jgi:hypothetical protein
MIRVLLADDQALVRGGFRLILDAEPDIEVVAEAADGDQAVAGALETRPDLVLMDIRMPVLDGIEATRRLVPQLGSTRVLMLRLLARGACPTPRSPRSWSLSHRPSSHTSPACSPSSACATGCRRWCSPTRTGSSVPGCTNPAR